jgi:hypothetical protein
MSALLPNLLDVRSIDVRQITHTKRGSACIALGLEQIRTHRRRHRKQLSYLLRISHGA